jgi:hypothetical protein
MTDPKPTLSAEGIQANINYYENLVAESYDTWQQYVNDLQYWLEQLEALK